MRYFSRKSKTLIIVVQPNLPLIDCNFKIFTVIDCRHEVPEIYSKQEIDCPGSTAHHQSTKEILCILT